MKTLSIFLLLTILAIGISSKADDGQVRTGNLVITTPVSTQPIPNPMIDYDGFLANAAVVGKLRETHRVTEQEFMSMSTETGTIIFDARNDSKFEMLHVKGAVHLDLTNATEADLARVIPSKTTRILIYCNNNFKNEPVAFTGKTAPTSLNIYTFNTLYGYGYKNVYELGPLLDITKTIIPFEGTRAAGVK